MIQIQFSQNRSEFQPGEAISGNVSWQLDDAPRKAELRLCWFTRGKGTEDAQVAEALPFDAPSPSDQRPFHFTAPSQPYSFSGRLISVIWALELVIEPKNQFERTEITIAPNGKEVVLPNVITENDNPIAAQRPAF